MGGIIGIVNFDGAPIDRDLLGRMTGFMAFRGPDAQEIWIDGNVGFGHTLLKTTDESEHERQPFSLDGRVWIVADARVDARAELIAKLKAKAPQGLSPYAMHPGTVSLDTTDVELILRAYHAWSENCVEHLLGDFSFAIWDGPQKRFFCARDQMGVKPFFYAHVGQRLIFSNTLDCIRQHPAVSDRLNDLAVADFLLFDFNQNKATTTFADIQRIPPAHWMVLSQSGPEIRRYWTLPIDEPVYYRRQDDYVDCFKDLLRIAVSERLRTDRVGIFMSGGMDSPTLAATAHELLRCSGDYPGVRAFTMSYEGYDEERFYAGLVTQSLGISIEFWDGNTVKIDPRWHETPVHSPEPVPYPNYLGQDRIERLRMTRHSRVALHGEGPDNALRHEWRPYLAYVVRRRRCARLFRDLGWLARLYHRTLLRRAARWLHRGLANNGARPLFPDWLNPDFERRHELRKRWEQLQVEPVSPHAVRPDAYQSFSFVRWQAMFEALDAAHVQCPLEVRHPFIDLRLIRYLLAIPVIPWCSRKYLLRTAMQGVLPDAVLRRPKSPLLRNPWSERVEECGLPQLIPAERFGVYVDLDNLSRATIRVRSSFWAAFRARSFNYWLQNMHPI